MIVEPEMTLDPFPMMEGFVPNSAGRTRDEARRDRGADLDDRFASRVFVLQLLAVLRGANRGASSRAGKLTGCEAGAGPSSPMGNLVSLAFHSVMLR